MFKKALLTTLALVVISSSALAVSAHKVYVEADENNFSIVSEELNKHGIEFKGRKELWREYVFYTSLRKPQTVVKTDEESFKAFQKERFDESLIVQTSHAANEEGVTDISTSIQVVNLKDGNIKRMLSQNYTTTDNTENIEQKEVDMLRELVKQYME